tara:strand:+ start:21304 stop:21924 length:621 start_codon:yes stop_codon:yes gene_type:complete
VSLATFSASVKIAEVWLSKTDPSLGQLIKNGSALDYSPFNKQPFEALVHAVIAQQLSVKSAAAIRQRVEALLPPNDVTPEAFSLIKPEQLKQAGLSRAKTNALHVLIDFTLSEKNIFNNLHHYPDQDVKQRLCRLKGIGPWTADIFLMFGLKRLDIFASGDLGLRKAIQLFNELDALPSPAECDAIAEKWQPYRTIASWHLWRTID